MLLAIKSCWQHHDRRVALRETWLNGGIGSQGIDVKFFTGWHARTKSIGEDFGGDTRIAGLYGETDVVCYAIDDGFKNIAPKVNKIMRYARTHGYTHVVVLDDDTYVVPERLLPVIETTKGNEYVGYQRAGDSVWGFVPYMCGCAYIVGETAIGLLAHDAHGTLTGGIPDDVAVGRVLHRAVEYRHDERFDPGPIPLVPSDADELITVHKCVGDQLRAIHARFNASRIPCK